MLTCEVLFYLGFQASVGGVATSGRHDSRSRKQRSHVLKHRTRSRESELEMVWIVKLSKPLSSNMLPPPRPHLRNLPKQARSTTGWGQAFKQLSLPGEVLIQTTAASEFDSIWRLSFHRHNQVKTKSLIRALIQSNCHYKKLGTQTHGGNITWK